MKKRLRTSDLIIGGTLFLTLFWNGICSLLAPGWIAASAIVAINWLIFSIYSCVYRDSLIGRLMLLALVAGWVELLADRWLVDVTGTLTYHSGGPFVFSSPLYMPFAWGVVLVQTAYVGWRLLKSLGKMWGVLITSLLGAVTIPLYEWWAKGAAWWYYQDTAMWGVVPLYIILGELLIACGLVLLIVRLDESSWWMVLLLGVGQGFLIWAAYAVSFSIVG